MFLGVLKIKMPLLFIIVTSLSNKRYFYHLQLLVITKSGRKKENKSNKFNRLKNAKLKCFSSKRQDKSSPPVYKPLSPPFPWSPNIDLSNLSFVRIFGQGVLNGFYGM